MNLVNLTEQFRCICFSPALPLKRVHLLKLADSFRGPVDCRLIRGKAIRTEAIGTEAIRSETAMFLLDFHSL